MSPAPLPPGTGENFHLVTPWKGREHVQDGKKWDGGQWIARSEGSQWLSPREERLTGASTGPFSPGSPSPEAPSRRPSPPKVLPKPPSPQLWSQPGSQLLSEAFWFFMSLLPNKSITTVPRPELLETADRSPGLGGCKRSCSEHGKCGLMTHGSTTFAPSWVLVTQGAWFWLLQPGEPQPTRP